MIVSPNIPYWLELDYTTTTQYYYLLLCPLVSRIQKSTYRIVTQIKIQRAELYIYMEIRTYGCRPYPAETEPWKLCSWILLLYLRNVLPKDTQVLVSKGCCHSRAVPAVFTATYTICSISNLLRSQQGRPGTGLLNLRAVHKKESRKSRPEHWEWR